MGAILQDHPCSESSTGTMTIPLAATTQVATVPDHQCRLVRSTSTRSIVRLATCVES